jgi:nucleoside-diphosphate-sugar epimerase
MALQSDPSVAARTLSWRAKVSLEEGLARTVDWLQGHLERYAPEHYAV